MYDIHSQKQHCLSRVSLAIIIDGFLVASLASEEEFIHSEGRGAFRDTDRKDDRV